MQQKRIEQYLPAEVQMMIDDEKDGIAIVDVREPWEYESDTGHVKNSILIPMNEIPEKIDYLREMAKKKRIGLICNSGSRSYHTAAYLKDNNIDNVFNIEGGILKWVLSGLEVEYGGVS